MQAEREAVECLKYRRVLAYGDRVLLTRGDLTGEHGGTNTMKIMKVGET